MTYAGAIQFLYSLQMFGAKLGLENPLRLAELAGHPERRLRFVHVAGTNGKGSTCAMLESIVRATGRRVGLFTSPHLVSFTERLQVDRHLISEHNVARLISEMQPWLKQFPPGRHPTFFEVVTVMALRYFAEQGCELVVWETGLGGRLDATNIVTPLASVITTIDFDHQQWLGDSLEQISTEKAGIIKAGVPVVTSARPGRGLEVIAATAARCRSPLTVVENPEWVLAGLAPELPLAGEHQRGNAALAVATTRVLAPHFAAPDSAVRDGLAGVRWPGRLQIVDRPGARRLVLDGAHNPGGALALRRAWEQRFPGIRPALVLGVLSDKDWAAIAATLAPLSDRLLLVPVRSVRSLAPAALAPLCRHAQPAARVEVCASLAEALTKIDGDAEPFALVAGSLFLIGEAMQVLGLSALPAVDEGPLNEWTAKSQSTEGSNAIP